MAALTSNSQVQRQTAPFQVTLLDGDFKPEFVGKMNFYQATVDNLVKTAQDGPTIGLILCRGKNKTVVEYTLRDVKSPIGVAEYRLLPPKLKAELPEAKKLKQLVAETEVTR